MQSQKKNLCRRIVRLCLPRIVHTEINGCVLCWIRAAIPNDPTLRIHPKFSLWTFGRLCCPGTRRVYRDPLPSLSTRSCPKNNCALTFLSVLGKGKMRQERAPGKRFFPLLFGGGGQSAAEGRGGKTSIGFLAVSSVVGGACNNFFFRDGERKRGKVYRDWRRRQTHSNKILIFLLFFYFPKKRQILIGRRLHSWLEDGILCLCTISAKLCVYFARARGIREKKKIVRIIYFASPTMPKKCTTYAKILLARF